MSKLSPDVLEMMSPVTTTKAKAQKLYRPSEVKAPQRMSSPSNASNTILDPSDTYLAPPFQAKFEQVAKAMMQEIHRARDRSLGRIVPSQRGGQSPVREEKTTNPEWSQSEVASDRHPKESQHWKNLLAGCAEQPRSCLIGMTWNQRRSTNRCQLAANT